MKIKGLLFCTIPVVILFLFLPSIHQSTMTTQAVVYPLPINYTVHISATGNVVAKNETVIQTSLPLVPAQVLVEEGEEVAVGQPLATIDKQSSLQALLAMLTMVSSVSPDLLSTYMDHAVLDEYFDTATAFSPQYDGGATDDIASLIPDVEAFPDTITATANGLVEDLSLTSGVINYPTQTAAVIANPTELIILLQVAETDVEQLSVGQAVTYTAAATDQTIYEGTVTKIGNRASETFTGMSTATVVEVEVTPTTPPPLRAGYSVQGKIAVTRVEQTPTLPYTAIGQDEQGEYVYLWQNGGAVRQPITTGMEFADYAEVSQGVHFTSPVLLHVDEVVNSHTPIRATAVASVWLEEEETP